MKKSASFGIIILALTISYIAYYKFIHVPKVLIDQYETCKKDARIAYDMSWLQQCNNQKKLPENCQEALSKGFPWLLLRRIRNESFDLTEEDFNNYNDYIQQVKTCSCETLPSNVAESINNDLKDSENKCLSELETINKVI